MQTGAEPRDFRGTRNARPVFERLTGTFQSDGLQIPERRYSGMQRKEPAQMTLGDVTDGRHRLHVPTSVRLRADDVLNSVHRGMHVSAMREKRR
jgi:hypothetical protein